jgi:hypothetical protein
MPAPEPHCHVKKDYRDRYQELTGKSLKTCPANHSRASLERIVYFATARPCSRAAAIRQAGARLVVGLRADSLSSN